MQTTSSQTLFLFHIIKIFTYIQVQQYAKTSHGRYATTAHKTTLMHSPALTNKSYPPPQATEKPFDSF